MDEPEKLTELEIFLFEEIRDYLQKMGELPESGLAFQKGEMKQFYDRHGDFKSRTF